MRPLSWLRLSLCALCIAVPIAAQENLALFPRFNVTGGGYLGDFGTQLRVDPHVSGLEGTTIDLEKTLGLESSRTLSRVALQWRPFRKHELEVSYFKTQREGRQVIDRQIVFEDTTFPIRADVRSNFNIDFLEANYTYWLRQSARDGLGINLGVTALSINAELLVRGDTDTSVLLNQTASTKLPVPVIGLEGRYQFTDHIIGIGRAAVLPRVSISDYQGEAYVGRFSIEYRPVSRIGVGVCYNYFNLNGVVEKTDFHADVGMTVSGVEGFVRIVFGGG